MDNAERLFQLSADLLGVAGMDGFFKEVNPAFERVLGHSLDEIKKRPFLEFVHPEDRDATLAEMKKLEGGAVTLHFENRYRCKDGSYKWLQWTSTPDLKRGLLFAVARDVTQLKEQEERLRRAEEDLRHSHGVLASRYKAVVRASGQLIYEWDTVTGAVSYSNAEVTLGYALEDMAGGIAHWIDLIHPEDRSRFKAEIDSATRSKQSFTLEYRVRNRDGSYLHVLDRGYFVTAEGGNPNRFVGFVADVSDRKRLEEQLRQAQKMEAVGALAGGVAHDFNNLLTVIVGYSELQIARLADGDPLRKDLLEIKKAADRAAALTRQLLAFSRKQVLQPRVIDLNETVAEMEKMLRRLVRADIEFVLALEPSLERVEVDPTQVEQVLMNLVVNARDAMPAGGRLVIETANVVLDETYPLSHIGTSAGPHVMLAVSDNGCGMDKKTRDRAFEPFFTTKGLGEGTGLGLATVYGIVQQSGGNIFVYSEPGAGTTFKVYFPQVQAPRESSVEQVPGGVARGSETILLVEDEDMVRALAKRVLQDQGYSVLETRDGVEALAQARQHKGDIDLVLTDVMMPRMSGVDLVQVLREARPRIKVLYMSGYTDQGIVRLGELSQGAAFLQKPFATDALAETVRRILDTRSPDSEVEATGEGAAGARPKKGRVLVLDDDLQVLLLLRTILEHGGYEVRVAKTGKEAMNLLASFAPGVVITDIFMPGEDGLEMIVKIRKEYPAVKILAISGGGSFPSVEPYLMAAKSRGAQKTLRKPLKPGAVLKAMEELSAG